MVPTISRRTTNFAFAIGPGVGAEKARPLCGGAWFRAARGATECRRGKRGRVGRGQRQWTSSNMSLGADFGTGDDADSPRPPTTPMKAGVGRRQSAGGERRGDNPLTCSAHPGASAKSITPSRRSAKEAFDTNRQPWRWPAVPATGAAAKTIQAINANGAALQSPGRLQVKVLRKSKTGNREPSACSPAEYVKRRRQPVCSSSHSAATCARRWARCESFGQAGRLPPRVVMIKQRNDVAAVSRGRSRRTPTPAKPFRRDHPVSTASGGLAARRDLGTVFALRAARPVVDRAHGRGRPIQTGPRVLSPRADHARRTPLPQKPDVTRSGRVDCVDGGWLRQRRADAVGARRWRTPHIAGMAALVIQAQSQMEARRESSRRSSTAVTRAVSATTRRVVPAPASPAPPRRSARWPMRSPTGTKRRSTSASTNFSTDFSKKADDSPEERPAGRGQLRRHRPENKQGSPHNRVGEPDAHQRSQGAERRKFELTAGPCQPATAGRLARQSAGGRSTRFHDVRRTGDVFTAVVGLQSRHRPARPVLPRAASVRETSAPTCRSSGARPSASPTCRTGTARLPALAGLLCLGAGERERQASDGSTCAPPACRRSISIRTRSWSSRSTRFRGLV